MFIKPRANPSFHYHHEAVLEARDDLSISHLTAICYMISSRDPVSACREDDRNDDTEGADRTLHSGTDPCYTGSRM